MNIITHFISHGEMNGILMMRRKIYEWGLEPYCNQIFNKDESPDWRPRNYYGDFLDETLQRFLRDVEEYKSLDFSIGTDVVGGVKICSYSELQQITDFRDESLIKKTLSGRLFHGTIGQGFEQRSVIVKTWDFHLPFKIGQYQLTYDFCDQIEFFTNKNANTHPKLAKLCTFCCDTRLAAVYDEKFDENITRLLSDVILEDDFGWDDRMKVAIQLPQLLVWLHEKGIIIGTVTASCIMIEDKEMNIKVFDFGSVSDHMHKGVKVPGKCHSGWEAPDQGNMTAKSDVFVFGLLLVELITKKEVDDLFLFPIQRDKKNIVDESFKEVDPETASRITSMTYRCTEMKADDRPTMKDVLNVLETAAAKMGAKGEKRKRDTTNEAIEAAKYNK
ncbi:receptor-like kinase LIP2 [Capsicum annuum]